MNAYRILTTALTLAIVTSSSIAQAQFGRGNIMRKIFERSSSQPNYARSRNVQSPSPSGNQPTVAPPLADAVNSDTVDDETPENALENQSAPKLGIFGAVMIDSEDGVVIQTIERGGDSETAGLREGDILKSIASLPVDQLDVLSALNAVLSQGEEITVEVARKNSNGDLEVQELNLVVTQGIPVQPAIAPSNHSASSLENAAALDSVLSESQAPQSAEPRPVDKPAPQAADAIDRSAPLSQHRKTVDELAEQLDLLKAKIREQEEVIERQAAQIRVLSR